MPSQVDCDIAWTPRIAKAWSKNMATAPLTDGFVLACHKDWRDGQRTKRFVNDRFWLQISWSFFDEMHFLMAPASPVNHGAVRRRFYLYVHEHVLHFYWDIPRIVNCKSNYELTIFVLKVAESLFSLKLCFLVRDSLRHRLWDPNSPKKNLSEMQS